MPKTLQDMVQFLSAAGIESPRLEAQLIAAAVLRCAPEDICSQAVFDYQAQNRVLHLLQRRAAHEPLDKILGHREFYKYDFLTNQHVLSPRPDTEILVEQAWTLLQKKTDARILDLGVGSGCIIETLLKEFPQATGVAVDISANALQVARQNAERLQVDRRLDFVEKSWFDADFGFQEKFDLVVSNPPYIPRGDIASLTTEVKDYDPLSALDGGEDGLESYRRIAQLVLDLLKADGYILLEVGVGQAAAVVKIFSEHLRLIDVVRDLSGIERCVIMQKSVAE